MSAVHHALMITAFSCLSIFPSFSQNQPLSADTAFQINDKEFSRITRRAHQLDIDLEKVNTRALTSLSRQQALYKKLLSAVHSREADAVSQELEQQYSSLTHQLTGLTEHKLLIPGLDTLVTTLSFLKSIEKFESDNALSESLSKLKTLSGRFEKAAAIEQFLDAQKSIWIGHLGLSTRIVKLRQLKKEVHYYKQHISQLKEETRSSERIRSRVLSVVQSSSQFTSFMNKHSTLSSLFRMFGPSDEKLADSAISAMVYGMQTKESTKKGMEEQFGKMGKAALQQAADNLGNGKKELDALQNKVSQFSQGGQEVDMPDFRPNKQKTKSLFNRMEVGLDFKSVKGSALIPVSTEITASVGYKLNDKSIIGFGAMAKIGWGSSFRDLSLTSRGFGVRSYLDWKIIKTVWITADYEISKQKSAYLGTQNQIAGTFKPCGFLGVTEKIPISSKFIKNSRIQLLLDVINVFSEHKSNPFIFRVGYNL